MRTARTIYDTVAKKELCTLSQQRPLLSAAPYELPNNQTTINAITQPFYDVTTIKWHLDFFIYLLFILFK
jgi:hypothetical protein